MRLKDELSPALKVAGANLKQTGAQMTAVGSSLLPISAALGAIGIGTVKAGVDFESSFAAVRNTVDATESQFAELSQGFRDMANEIPVSVNELNRVGEAAGQLGIETENILSFSRTMADLGVTTNLSADQAATSLARLANITGMSQEDFDRLGSTVVELGNNMATTEAEIVDMGLRLAGIGTQVGLTEAEILGMAGAMSSLGIQAEAGGTAMTKTLSTIQSAVVGAGADLDRFAQVAGVTAEQFTQAWKDDPVEALTLVLDGLNDMQAAGGDTTAAMDALDLTGIRVQDTLRRMATDTGMLSEATKLGTRAWEENTALAKEAEQRYGTFASQLTVFWNQVKDIAITIGTALMPTLRDMLTAAQPLLTWAQKAALAFAELPAPVRMIAVGLGALVTAAGPVLIIAGQLVSAFGAVAGVLGGAAGGAGLAGALGTVVTFLTGPVGITVAVVAALATFKPFRDFLGSLIGVLIAVGKKGLEYVAGKFKALLKWIKPVTDRIAALVSWAGEKLGGALEFASDSMDDFTASIQGSSRTIQANEGRVQSLQVAMARAGGTYVANTGKVTSLAAALAESNVTTDAATDAAEGLNDEVQRFIGLQPALEGGYQGAELALRDWADEMDAAMFTLASFDQQWREFVDGLDDIDIAQGLADEIGDAFASLDTFDAEFVLDPPVTIPDTGSFMGSIKKLFSGNSALGQGITGALGGLFSGDGVGASIANGLKTGLSMAANMIVPGLGTLMAPLIDGITNLFSNIFKKASVGEDLGRDLGVSISTGLMDSIEGTADQVGDIYAAITLRLGDVMDEVGITSADMLETFARRTRDLFSHIEQGLLSTSQVQGVINDQFEQLVAGAEQFGGAGIEQIQELIALAERFGITIDSELIERFEALGGAAVSAADLAQDAWIAWAEGVGVSFERAKRHNRAYFEALAEQMGLAGETAEAWIDGMLKNQREANKEFEQSQRQAFRAAAIEAGLSGDQIREFVRANMKQIRQAERQAERERKNERRQREVEEIGSGKLIKDRMLQFAGIIENRWLGMYDRMGKAAMQFASSASLSGGGPAGVASFQTHPGQMRVVPGPPTQPVPAVLHGGEIVMRPGGGSSSSTDTSGMESRLDTLNEAVDRLAVSLRRQQAATHVSSRDRSLMGN